MFGAYRALLACMVVAQHLGGAHVLGAYAVFGFYILSGYLMTAIMQNNYGYSFKGVTRYALNRFLRVYPMYWVSICCSLALILWLGENFTTQYHSAIFMPRNYVEIIKNISIYFPAVELPRLTPPSWALTVELCFYIFIGLGLSRSKKLVAIWLVLSIVYHLIAHIKQWGWASIYFSIPAASLPFATGAFIYHYKNTNLLARIAVFAQKLNWLPFFIMLAICVNWWLGIQVGASQNICFYINYIFCALMVLLLVENGFSGVSSKVDKWLGAFSFPIYLIHYQVGVLTLVGLNTLGLSYVRPDLHLFLFSLPVIVMVAYLLIVFIESPIETLRIKIRPRQ